MGLLDKLKNAFSSPTGAAAPTHWIYARCRRCGEPLRGRVDLRAEPSLTEDGGWIVRKGLIGSGANRCFQTVEVTLQFDAEKRHVVESQVAGGELIDEAEFEKLVAAWPPDESTTKE